MNAQAATPRDARTKVAVVVIHGMGEQRPMDTLRGVVETVWERDSSLFEVKGGPSNPGSSTTWSKPDRVSGSAELRRIKTARVRTPGASSGRFDQADFFELHWADITADSIWRDFRIWFSRLLRRNPFGCEVPRRLLVVWMLLWIISIAVIVSGLSLATVFFMTAMDREPPAFLRWGNWVWAALALLFCSAIAKAVLISYFGDVARYVSATPRNIKVRQMARERGVNLLRQLHATGDYGRIVVVGHSLGSILAHDLIALLWAEAAEKIRLQHGSAVLSAISDCEKAGLELLGGDDAPNASASADRHERGCKCALRRVDVPQGLAETLRRYRLKQRELFYALSSQKIVRAGEEQPAWLISDLITVGSPLAHASFLLARNGCELRAMTRAREILRAPPTYESGRGRGEKVFHFSIPPERVVVQMHHAAAFAPVRWTNLHDASGAWLFLRGDLISGPLAPDFGPGVLDLRVRPRRGGWWGTVFPRLFTHTLYWTYPAGANVTAPDHIKAFRCAVNVLDDQEVEGQLLACLETELDKRQDGLASKGGYASQR